MQGTMEFSLQFVITSYSIHYTKLYDIFLTHTHLDHIIGFPFFAPIYQSGTRLKIYGPVTWEDDSLQAVLGGQLSYRYFPVRQEELAARIDYINLKEGCFDLGDRIQLTTQYLNHPSYNFV